MSFLSLPAKPSRRRRPCLNANACFLDSEALIHLHGANATEFLQGQLTCDLRRLTPTHSLPGALCNPQGRVISDLRIIALDPAHLVLRLRASLCQPCVETLQRYAQFSRVEVSPDSREGAILGIYGDAPIAELPAEPNAIDRRDDLLVLGRDGGIGEVIALSGAEESLRAFAETLPAGEENQWQARVLAGGHYPLDAEDSGQFTPQTLNFDERDLVAFDKGCYTGQEVVARLHYKGRAKRRLRIYRAPEVVEAKERLSDAGGSAVGKVLRCVPGGDGYIVAAEVSADSPAGPLLSPDGVQLTPV